MQRTVTTTYLEMNDPADLRPAPWPRRAEADSIMSLAVDLPQIFIKETAVIFKSAIYEEPFQPQIRARTELVRGITDGEYPKLLGYVASSPKPRAETPLWTDKGDPLLAHWQYGLGRAVAFTSDAKPRWAKIWLNWDKYRQFWLQIGQLSMRRLENADFTTEVAVDKGEGLINVEALDDQGNFRNFLNLQAIVVSPKGERQTVRLEQTGPGHYEARFPTKDVGAYLLNLMDVKDGKRTLRVCNFPGWHTHAIGGRNDTPEKWYPPSPIGRPQCSRSQTPVQPSRV